MIKKLLLSLLGVALCVTIFSQNQNDSIQSYKVFGGYRFESNGKILTYGSMYEMMKNNPDASQFMSKAKNSASFANVLGFAGGFMIGWPIGAALGGGKPNWTMAGVGCGLIVIAIPVISSSNKNALTAIKKYNSGLNGLSYENQFDLKLGVSPTGLSLKMTF